MPSAFVSYAHEDHELVLVLVEHLGEQGLDIRYDQVALHIGDSLIRAISQEIKEGDFLIAIVSPDSVASEWCQKELALAMTEGINERRVKVLPVKFRGAEMPPMIGDAVYADADVDDPETVARRLAAAMQKHLEGRESEAARAAEEVEKAEGRPAHQELAGDVVVAQVDEVAQRVMDVVGVWEGIPMGHGNVRDLADPQRRLRWTLSNLPDRVRLGLPLTARLADADWDDFFDTLEPNEAERDLEEELRSVRTQVAQGLPVARRWTIQGDLEPGPPERRDAVSYLWRIVRDGETRLIQVYISNSAIASGNEHLPVEVAKAKETCGRSVVVSLLALDDPPEAIAVSTAGIGPLPD